MDRAAYFVLFGQSQYVEPATHTWEADPLRVNTCVTTPPVSTQLQYR